MFNYIDHPGTFLKIVTFLILASCAKTHYNQSAEEYHDIDTDRWFEYIKDIDQQAFKDTALTIVNCIIENGDLTKIRHMDESIALVLNQDENCQGWVKRTELINFKLTEKRPFKIGWQNASSDSLILE